jgi:Ca2+-binding RTX toxin-like protein
MVIKNFDDPANSNDGAPVNVLDFKFNQQTVIGNLALNFSPTIVDADGDSATLTDGLTVGLVGGSSDDFTLTGLNANPEAIASGEGKDTISGGTGGNDTVDYSNSDAAVTVDLSTNTVSGGYATGDTISGIENVFGSKFNDTLTGNSGDNKLYGFDGDDTIHGGDGKDTLDGGTGTDHLFGDAGDDTLIFRSAASTHDGGSNTSNDLLSAGNTGDVLDAHNIASLDLTAISDAQFAGIETIRMTGGGSQTLTLDASDVIDFGTGVVAPGGSNGGQNYDSKDALRVEGDAGDTVNLSGGNWFVAAGASGAPAGYDLYVHVTGGANPAQNEDAYLLVQHGITVTGAV